VTAKARKTCAEKERERERGSREAGDRQL